jgi:dipeptidyl aminopeptidase/acylaminoacyl peptidase
MFLVYPPGFDPKRKWPLVHVIHGGPYGASMDDFHYRWNAALFASRGYVVSMVNFHGSTGYGQAFEESILGNHGDKPFEDIMKATDWLIAQGYIDETKMAATGGSYGGYLVNWILGHTDRFAAIVSHAGVYDLMGQFASDDTYGRPNNYGGAPWTDPAKLTASSPSHYAKNFKTPTLITHGEKDFRVPVTQGINLFGVLQAQGVPARIVIFPEENHWILKPQSGLLWWKEVFAWLDRYLG